VQGPLTGMVIADRWRLTNFIHAGSFGQVYEAVDRRHRRHRVAVKLIKFVLPEDQSRAITEANMLQGLRHSNIVTYYHSGEIPRVPMGGSWIYIVMEFAEADLRRLIESSRRRQVASETLRQLMIGWSEGLTFLHDSGYVHRDIKPENLLVVNRIPKLGDFGLTRRLVGTSHLSDQTFATFPYVSPEFAETGRFRPADDVWALGVCIMEALSGLRPYNGEGIALLNAIRTRPPAIPKLPPAWDEVVRRCLVPQDRRITAGQLHFLLKGSRRGDTRPFDHTQRRPPLVVHGIEFSRVSELFPRPKHWPGDQIGFPWDDYLHIIDEAFRFGLSALLTGLLINHEQPTDHDVYSAMIRAFDSLNRNQQRFFARPLLAQVSETVDVATARMDEICYGKNKRQLPKKYEKLISLRYDTGRVQEDFLTLNLEPLTELLRYTTRKAVEAVYDLKGLNGLGLIGQDYQQDFPFRG
jgi:serine/threonine protein kinase